MVNVRIEGFLVDARWPARRLVVELDGGKAHATAARLARDRAKDLVLRRAGYTILRYSWLQVHQQDERVAADVRAALEALAA